MNKIRKNTSLILTFIATLFLSLALAFSNVGMNNVKASDSDNPIGFTLESGTDIAVSSDYSGIRWETKVSKAYFNSLKEAYPDATFTFGTWVVPANTVSGIEEIDENFAGALNIEANNEGVIKTLEGFTSEMEEVSYFSVVDYDSIVNAYIALHEVDPDNYPLDNADDIKANAYKVLVMARSYVKIESNGVTEYNYSGAELAQSARLVATLSIISGKTSSSSANYDAVLDFIGSVAPVKNEVAIKYNILHSDKYQSFAFPELVGKTIDEIAFNSTKIDYAIEGENLVIKTDISACVGEEKNYLIAYTSEGVIYKEVELLNIIETPNDFVKAFSLAEGALTTASNIDELAVFDKDYYLANNLDFTGFAMPTETFTYSDYKGFYENEKIIKKGLTGNFYGQGYAIYNLAVPQGGLFGMISGTIQDVAFINCSINVDNSEHTGFLAQMVSENAVIKNVYIKLNDSYSATKHIVGSYVHYLINFEDCYFEADLSLILSPITHANAFYTSGLTKESNRAVIITRQMLGSRQRYGTDNGIDGNINGTTINRPYYGTSIAPDADFDEDAPNKHPRKNRIKGQVYRYESIEDMLKYYNGEEAQTPYLKSLIEYYATSEFYYVADGIIGWKNDYSLYNGDEQVNNQIVLRNEFGLNEASFSVKDGLGNLVDGFTYELLNNNGVITLEGSKITLANYGDEELLVKKDGVVYFTVSVSATKPIVESTEETRIIDANGELFDDIETEIVGVVVRSNSVTATFSGKNIALVGATAGEVYDLEVETTTNVIIIKVRFVTAYIKTAEEFVETFALAKGELTSATTLEDLATFDGYYLLGNNIDFAGKQMPTEAFTLTGYIANEKFGLSGTFDGNGYAIYNLVAPEGGVFGVVSGTVKNVAFINCDTTNSGIVAKYSTDTGVFTNVYVKYSGAYSDSKYLFVRYPNYEVSINTCYFEGNLRLYWGSTNGAAGIASGLNNANNTAVIVTKHILGVRSTATGYHVDANIAGSTDSTAYLNDSSNDKTNIRYNTKGETYRYEDVQKLSDMYTNKDSAYTEKTEAVKTLVDKYENGYYVIGANGKIAWKNDTTYCLYQEDALITDKIIKLQTTGDTEAMIYVKNVADIELEGISFELSNNDGVVTLDGAKITVIKEGTANLLVKKNGELLVTLTVEVSKPIVSKDLTIEVEQDSAEGSENGVLSSEELALIFGSDSNVVVAVKSADEELVVELGDNNQLLFKNANGSDFVATGKSYKIIIFNDVYGVELNVMPITKIIRQASDLAIFTTIAKDKQVGTESVPSTQTNIADLNTFPGYYILAGNIDASSVNAHSADRVSTHSRIYLTSAFTEDSADGALAKTKGLTGTFDGRGYTISNLYTTRGGLFGIVSGTIKNVAFDNIRAQWRYYNSAESNGTFSDEQLLGSRAMSTAVIENVYINATNETDTEARVFRFIAHTAKLTNVYVQSTNGGAFSKAAAISSSESQTGGVYRNAYAYANFSNVIYVSNYGLGGANKNSYVHVTKDANSNFGVTGNKWELKNETIKTFADASDMTTMYQAEYPYTGYWGSEATTSAKTVIDAFENEYFNVIITKADVEGVETITNVAITWVNLPQSN